MISSLMSCNKKTPLLSDKSASSSADADKTSNKDSNKITTYYDEVTLEGTQDFSGIYDLRYSGDKLYVLGQKVSEENCSLFSTDPATLETSSTQKNISIPDVKEEDTYKDSNGNIYNCAFGKIEIYDKDSRLIKTIDNKSFYGHDDIKQLFMYSSTVSENGDIYIAASEKTSESIQIIKLNSSFEIQYITEKGDFSDCGNYIDKIFIGENGNPVLCTSSDQTYVNEISTDTGRTLLRYELPLSEQIIGGYGDYSLIYRNGSIILGYSYLNDDTSELYGTDTSVSEIRNAYIRDNAIITEQIQTGDGETLLNIYNKDGKPENSISITGTDQIDKISIASEGKVYILDEHYGLEYTDDGAFETTQPEIFLVNEDGTTQSVYKGEKQNSEIHYIFGADDQGNICICQDHCDGNNINATYISSDGTQTEMTYEGSGHIACIQCINGQLFLAFFSFENNSTQLLQVNKDTSAFEKASDIKSSSNTFIPGSGDYDLYYSPGNVISGYHLSDGSSEKIFSWFDSDAENIPYDDRFVAVADPENIFYVKENSYTENYDPQTGASLSVVHLKKADEARLKELNSRNIITLAGIHINDVLFSQIKKFNKSSNDSMIHATDYSQYNTDVNGDDSAALSRLQTDIAKGDIPDVIVGNWSFDIQSFLSKDSLTDLNDMLRNDPEIDSNDLAENILDACKYNGKLYCIPWSCSLSTLSVPDECIENDQMLTFDEFFTLADRFKDMPLINSPRESLSRFLLTSYISENVDFEKSTCSFETDIFRKILDKLKECVPQEVYYSEENMAGKDGETVNQCLFNIKDRIYQQDIYFCLTEWDSPHACRTVKGVPSSSGITSLIDINQYLCITNSCENKEEAWKFIKYSTQITDKQNTYSFGNDGSISILRSKNQDALKTNISNMSEDNYDDYTQSDIDKLTKTASTIFDGKILADSNYSGIYKIINEQSDKYYNNTQSLDETVSAIQSKVQLYLSEIG